MTAPPVPTLYLHGADDGGIGAESGSVTSAHIYRPHGSSSEMIDGAGHFLHLEQPELIAERSARGSALSSPSPAGTSRERIEARGVTQFGEKLLAVIAADRCSGTPRSALRRPRPYSAFSP